jgi:formate hydrogenlyase subunit 4
VSAVPIPVIQLLQVLTVALGAPGVTGVIARVEARLQGRRGPRVLQPYYDLAKLFRKEALAPEQASWFFLAAPLIAVTCYLTIPLLIPVLTSYGLPLGYMGDILGGGFLLSLASFVVATAALETGSPYAQLGSSRVGKSLRDTLSGFHSARLGNQWRVLYRIDESKHAVIVQDIQHRSTAYRRR